jgi:predicted dinucleotide-binding enzyme
MFEIAILGTGSVGRALGARLAQVGHPIHYGSRNPNSDRLTQWIANYPSLMSVSDPAQAARACSVVILAVPFGGIEAMIKQTGSWAGKTLIDCSNPLNASFDGLELGFNDSAAEQIARWATGAHVVKAFNTASVATMMNPVYNGHRATMFYCGDNAESKLIVRRLIDELHMDPVDSGPLKNARYLEPMAMLYIHLAIREGWGAHCALKMLQRTPSQP